jgi:hypothetical protein
MVLVLLQLLGDGDLCLVSVGEVRITTSSVVNSLYCNYFQDR